MSKTGSLVRFSVVAIVLAMLWHCGFSHAQSTSARQPVLLAPGARCGFLVECSHFDEIGLHLGTGAAFRTDARRSYWDTQGALRLSLTVGDLAEGGVAFTGHMRSDGESGLQLSSSPIALYVRLRLLPLPLRALAWSPLRLALSYQHDLVAEPFGQNEPPGISRGTLRLVAGQSLGRVDLDGSIGFVVAQPDASRPRLVAFDLGAAVSVWLWRGVDRAPSEEFRLTGEALTRFSLSPAFPSEHNLLVGFLGKSVNGYGGGVAIGTQVLDRQAGFLAVARLQISWGKKHKNPWAERKAAEPVTTPAFIWKLLGAIDPVLGPDGCVWTDPTPERPSSKWFCVGTPAADDPSQIVIKGGQRVPAGTHLWETGSVLRLDDGSKVVEIPLHARFRKAVWDFVDENEREAAKNREKYRQQVCEGKISILHGAENNPGLASMIALDEFGGRAALIGEELLRYFECNPNPSLEEQAMMALNALGAARASGPLRAKPPLTGRIGEAAENEAPAGKAGSGVPADSGTNPVALRSRIKDNPYAVRLAESLSEQAQRDVDKLLLQLANGNRNPGIGTRPLGGGFYELRGSNAGRVIINATGNGTFDIVGKFQGHVRGDAANSATINRLIQDYLKLAK